MNPCAFSGPDGNDQVYLVRLQVEVVFLQEMVPHGKHLLTADGAESRGTKTEDQWGNRGARLPSRTQDAQDIPGDFVTKVVHIRVLLEQPLEKHCIYLVHPVRLLRTLCNVLAKLKAGNPFAKFGNFIALSD